MKSQLAVAALRTALLGVLVLGFAPAAHAAGVSIEKACEQIFQEKKRKESETVNDGRHGFRVVPAEVKAEGDTITVKGFFFHVISGRNDKVYYTIVVKKGQPYEATIDSIELGGLFGESSKVRVGVTWVARVGGGLAGAQITGSAPGALKGATLGDKISGKVLSVANKVQRELIGNWTPSAPVILDGMAKYFAAQLK